MSDTPRVSPLGGPSGDRLQYTPISGYAIAAIICSGLFGLILTALVIIAFINKKPILTSEILVLAIAGFVLSLIGRSQISRSEGTREGLGLCNLSWWICILGGAGFASYTFASDLALRKQSEAEGTKWMNYLTEGKYNNAFLAGIEPGRRQAINPEDTAAIQSEFGRANYEGFMNNQVIRLFERHVGNKQMRVDPAGIRNWTNTPSGYDVQQSFRLISAEGAYTVTLLLSGKEGANIRGRLWTIKPPLTENPFTEATRTTFGYLLNEDLAIEASGFALRFLDRLSNGTPQSAKVFLADIKTQQEFERRAKKAQQILGGLFSLIEFPLEMSWDESKFFQLLDGSAPNTEQLSQFRFFWSNAAIKPAGSNRSFLNSDRYPRYYFDDKTLQMEFPVEVSLTGAQGGIGSARVVIRAENPEFIEAINKIRNDGWANPFVQNAKRVFLSDLPPRNWRVVAVKSNVTPLPPAEKEGP